MGQAVTLRSVNHFADGSRASRVRGFEKKLRNKYEATYIIGESSAYSRSDALEEQVKELTYQSKQFVNVYGNSVYVVGRYDTTAPSDVNVPSFKRAQYEFLQKNVPDRALEKIIFGKGADFGDYVSGEQGGTIDRIGNAELLTLVVRHLLRSPQFRNGMTGEGFRLWINDDGLAELELDRLTVRQIMTVFELIIDRIRAVGGQIIVSAANGKIKSVTDAGDSYTITFDGDNYFQPHDLMRCQVFTGDDIRGYWVEVLAVNGDSVVVAKSEFSDWNTEPRVGDECVLMGNTQNVLRQNLISISATDDGQPRIDVLDGVNGKNLNDALRARMGNLDGINDTWFPLDNQPHGNGLYADNAYLRGTFLLTTGEDIKTKFEIVEGRIESTVEAIRQDFMQDKGFLNNPTFGDGLTYWTAENETVFFMLGNRWIWANDNVLSKKGDGASVVSDDNRRVVRIKNKYIKQKFADLRGVPEIKTNSDGKKEPTPIYLSFFYKVKKAGTLKVGFENIDNTGFIDYITFEETMQLEPTQTYQQMTLSGLWNATGDFKLSFTGEIFVYMLVLSTDRIESLTHTYRTLFEQSERLVKISAAIFDRNEQALKETGLLIRPEGAGLYALDAEGGWASIGVMTDGDGGSKAVIQADHIQLEGLVTANGNFKILADGSIETINGKFSGEITADVGYIGGFKITSNSISAGGGYSGGDYGGVDSTSSKFFLYSSGSGFLGFSDKYHWIGIGLDTMPAGTMIGGCQLRISNEVPSEFYDNYAAYINVSGGRNNIGLFMYGDIRANARGYHSLNGTVVIDGADELRVATDMKADGTYTQYFAGVSFNPADYDLDKVRFQVRNGLIVAVIHE